MKKSMIFLLCVSIIFCFLFSGCRDIPEVISDNDPILEIASDFFYLASEQVFYECDYGGYGLFYVPLISGSPLTQNDLEVELAGTILTKEQCILGEVPGREERVELPFYVYQTFRGKDWKAEAALQIEYREQEGKNLFGNEESTQIMNAIIASQNEFLPDYEALQSAGELPVLYRYLLTFIDIGRLSEEVINEITLRIRGVERTFPVGGIYYKEENSLPPSGPGTLINSRGIAGWHGASTDSNGNITESNGIMSGRCRATEDITITAIDLWQDDRTLSDIQVIIMNAPSEGESTYDEVGNEIVDIVADFVYDGHTAIALSKGQELAVNFTLCDPRLKNAICGYTEYEVALHYENSAGEKGVRTLWYPSRIETVSGDPFEIYLQYVLDMDMMSYYTDYYDILEPLGGVAILDPIKEE